MFVVAVDRVELTESQARGARSRASLGRGRCSIAHFHHQCKEPPLPNIKKHLETFYSGNTIESPKL